MQSKEKPLFGPDLTRASMVRELVKIANELDSKGLFAEADSLDQIINDLGDFSDLDNTNITKDEAFQAGVAVCDASVEEEKADSSGQASKVAGELERRSLTKEADALDSLVEEKSFGGPFKGVVDKVKGALKWVEPLQGVSECSKLTAATMVSQAANPSVRNSMPGCAAAGYEYSDNANKIEILKALWELDKKGSAYDVKTVVANYMQKLVTDGHFKGEMLQGDRAFLQTFIGHYAGDLHGWVTDAISLGVNMGNKAMKQHRDRIDNTTNSARKSYTTKQRGV